ncbi:MAG: cation transporter dimerization domain-containing protein, partial [Pontibacterium sp.]
AHSLKTRHMANKLLLELHIQVSPHCSASEGHFIGNQCINALKQSHPDLGHIIFHIDTYDDADEENLLLEHNSLPSVPPIPRSQIESMISAALADQHINTNNWQLQIYYDKKIHLKLMFEDAAPSPQVIEALQQAFTNEPWLGSIQYWQSAQCDD